MAARMVEQTVANKVWAFATKTLHEFCLRQLKDGHMRKVTVTIEVENLTDSGVHKTTVKRERIG